VKAKACSQTFWHVGLVATGAVPAVINVRAWRWELLAVLLLGAPRRPWLAGGGQTLSYKRLHSALCSVHNTRPRPGPRTSCGRVLFVFCSCFVRVSFVFCSCFVRVLFVFCSCFVRVFDRPIPSPKMGQLRRRFVCFMRSRRRYCGNGMSRMLWGRHVADVVGTACRGCCGHGMSRTASRGWCEDGMSWGRESGSQVGTVSATRALHLDRVRMLTNKRNRSNIRINTWWCTGHPNVVRVDPRDWVSGPARSSPGLGTQPTQFRKPQSIIQHPARVRQCRHL
jgi:hypothetical protein